MGAYLLFAEVTRQPLQRLSSLMGLTTNGPTSRLAHAALLTAPARQTATGSGPSDCHQLR